MAGGSLGGSARLAGQGRRGGWTLELSEEDVVLGAGGLVGWAPLPHRSSSLIADPPPPAARGLSLKSLGQGWE